MKRRSRLGQPAVSCAAIRIEQTHEVPDPSWDKPIRFAAMRNGDEIGYLEAYRYEEQRLLKPGLIEVDPRARRCGVNTRLHTAAARYACDEGLVVISDQYRTENTQLFWEKLRRKGKARCVAGTGYKISPEGDMDEVIGTWPCRHYEVEKCMLDFSGPRRAARRRRSR